eukprot:m.251572 g.251572  ORF g.251572 m.251572 type:complete len:192 (-) comp10975_c0_seq25:553-1128(-)
MWYDALTCSLWRPWGLFPFLRLRGVVCAEAQIDSSTNSRDARLAPAMPPGENSLEQLLLIAAANGEDAEVKNTPLQSALDYTQTSTIKLLLSRGADVNCKDVVTTSLSTRQISSPPCSQSRFISAGGIHTSSECCSLLRSGHSGDADCPWSRRQLREQLWFHAPAFSCQTQLHEHSGDAACTWGRHQQQDQ